MQVERGNPEQEIIKFISTNLISGKDIDLGPDAELIADGLLDSVAMVELVVWIEDSFGLRVAIDDLTPDTFGSVRKIAAYIARSEARARGETA